MAIYRDVKKTCSNEKPPGEHTSGCEIEKSELAKAYKPCSKKKK